MIANQISKVLRYALNAFPARTENKYFPFEEKLSELKLCLDKTTAGDIGFHDKYTGQEFWENSLQAPIGYIEIYEGINITLGVFILKPGMKMPLHDHPHMYGLLKVIAGQVRIHSYTVKDEDDYVLSPEKLQSLAITAQKNPILTVNSQSESILLQPKLGNLHEIVCDEENAAAFIDVLSPPYETLINVKKSLAHSEDSYNSYLPRKCRFFEIIEQLNDDLVKMNECKSPDWFWTSREEYLGPKVIEPADSYPVMDRIADLKESSGEEEYIGPTVVIERTDPDVYAVMGGIPDLKKPNVVQDKISSNIVDPESGDAAVTSTSVDDSNSKHFR